MEPATIFQKAWDILVEHAGASKDPDARTSFVHAYTERKFPASEWRFGGHLGFGGKFWRNGRYYISCYPEDRTKKREAIIEKVNALLTELPYFHP